MQMVHHSVLLSGSHEYGAKPPAGATGVVLEFIDLLAQQATLMTFRGRSTSPGKKPNWYTQSTDIRLVHVESQDGDTRLEFEAPALGEAAEELYKQPDMLKQQPAPGNSALNLVANMIGDVANENRDSDRFDERLLRTLATERLRRLVNGKFFDRFSITNGTPEPVLTSFDKRVSEHAQEMLSITPAAQAVRIAGRLDMLKASTGTFSLILDDGVVVRGSFPEEMLETVRPLLDNRVLVHGVAHYKPSAKLLRIHADAIEDGRNAATIWSSVPSPRVRRLDPVRRLMPQTLSSGVPSFFGSWPGSEGEDEFSTMLDELS